MSSQKMTKRERRKERRERQEKKENASESKDENNNEEPSISEDSECLSAAKTMVSILKEENSSEKRKQSRLAAKKTREKRTQFLIELQDRIWALTKANEEMQKKLDTATITLGQILEEADRSLTNKRIDMYRIANLLLAAGPHFFLSMHHKYLLQKLRSFFYEENNE